MFEQSALSNSLFQQMSQSYLKDITRNLNSSQLSVSERVKMEPLRCIIFPERKEYDKYVIHSTLNCVSSKRQSHYFLHISHLLEKVTKIKCYCRSASKEKSYYHYHH